MYVFTYRVLLLLFACVRVYLLDVLRFACLLLYVLFVTVYIVTFYEFLCLFLHFMCTFSVAFFRPGY